MKTIYSTFLFLALAFCGLSCQDESSAGQQVISFNQPFNIPFGQSVVLPDQSRLIFAQVLHDNPIFKVVSNTPQKDTRVKMVLCKSDNEKEDFVLSMGETQNLQQLGLENVELQLVDLLSLPGVNESPNPENYVLRLSLVNRPRP